MSDWQWQLGIPGGATAAWALGLALFALWLVELRSMRGENPRRSAVLAALGALGVTALFLLALQVTLVRETFEEVAGGTAVLLDNSQSMRLAGSRETRAESVTSLVERWQKDGRVNPLVYLFGEEARGTAWEGLAQSYEPNDDTTNIL